MVSLFPFKSFESGLGLSYQLLGESVFNNPIRLKIRPIQILFIGWAKSILTLEAGLGTIHNTYCTNLIEGRVFSSISLHTL